MPKVRPVKPINDQTSDHGIELDLGRHELRRDVETALREGRMGYEESGQLLKFYEEGLHGYTYLEDVHER